MEMVRGWKITRREAYWRCWATESAISFRAAICSLRSVVMYVFSSGMDASGSSVVLSGSAEPGVRVVELDRGEGGGRAVEDPVVGFEGGVLIVEDDVVGDEGSVREEDRVRFWRRVERKAVQSRRTGVFLRVSQACSSQRWRQLCGARRI